MCRKFKWYLFNSRQLSELYRKTDNLLKDFLLDFHWRVWLPWHCCFDLMNHCKAGDDVLQTGVGVFCVCMFCFECWRSVVGVGVLVKLGFVETLLEICLWSVYESIQKYSLESIQGVVYQNSYTELGEKQTVFFLMVFNSSSQKVTCSEHSSLEHESLLSSMKETVFTSAEFWTQKWLLYLLAFFILHLEKRDEKQNLHAFKKQILFQLGNLPDVL